VEGAGRLGVMYRRHRPPRDLVPFARWVESLGFDELWVVEDCFWAGGISAATAVLATTERLDVGLGIAPAVVRNPALAAMELSGVAGMFPGRFIAGFGHGVHAWMAQIGALPRSQLAALEETLDAVSRLLRGERITVHGTHVSLDGVELVFPPDPPPPIVCGVTGPRSLELTGRLADGAVLPEGSSPDYVSTAIERMARPGAACTVYALFAVDDDGDAARTAVLPALERFAPRGVDQRLARLGPVVEVADEDRATRYAVAGTPGECATALAALRRAGATSIVAVPQPDDQEQQVVRLARDVVPLLG
jgi:5,10-methylenetetrahydromethanopterin reductase